MGYIRDRFYKIKFIIKFTSRKWIKVIETFFSLLGIILAIGEFTYYAFTSDIIYLGLREHKYLIILGLIFVAFIINKVKLSYEYFLKDTDIKINLKVTNVLKENTAIVISTNTTFDTKMENEFISIQSVQGQFQRKYFEDNLETLDNLIEKGLEGYSYENVNRKNSKSKKYPIGTISKITYNGIHYYFVAIADINEYGKTVNTKFENIQLVLEKLWNELENKGHIENIAIPLIGTGKAGIKDVSRTKIVQEIISSFIDSSKKRKITEKLLICVHPLDLEHKDLDLEELDEYLRLMCKYR